MICLQIICNVASASQPLILLTTVKLMKMTTKRVTPQCVQHFYLKCSKHFDNFALRIPEILMSGVFEIMKPTKATVSSLLSSVLKCMHALSPLFILHNFILSFNVHSSSYSMYNQTQLSHSRPTINT